MGTNGICIHAFVAKCMMRRRGDSAGRDDLFGEPTVPRVPTVPTVRLRKNTAQPPLSAPNVRFLLFSGH